MTSRWWTWPVAGCWPRSRSATRRARSRCSRAPPRPPRAPRPRRPRPARRARLVTMSGVTYADHGTKDVRKLSKLELEADDYYFGPTFLRGNPGQKLTLMIENEVEHPAQHHDPRARRRQGHPTPGQGPAGRHVPGLGRADLLVQVSRPAGDGRHAQGGRVTLITLVLRATPESLASSCENFPRHHRHPSCSPSHWRAHWRVPWRLSRELPLRHSGEGYRGRRARHRLPPDGVRLDVRRTRDHGPRGLLDRQLACARTDPGHESPSLPWSVRGADRARVLPLDPRRPAGPASPPFSSSRTPP